jgi:hypothetical protein
MRVDITPNFSLEPVVLGGVVYVQWAAILSEDAIKARWNTFRRSRCAGQDARGVYYHDKAHALTVIRAFQKKEEGRKKT